MLRRSVPRWRLLPASAVLAVLALIVGTLPVAAAKPPLPADRFAVSDVTVTEGVDSAATVTITRGGAYSAPASVLFSTDTDASAAAAAQAQGGTGNPGDDYQTISKQLVTFAQGETSKQVSIPIYSDYVLLEPTQYFLATIKGYKGSKVETSTATVTIAEDPVPAGTPALTVAASNPFQNQLTWTGSTGVVQYVVWQCTDSTPGNCGTLKATVPAATTSYTDSCATVPGRTYYYSVQAVNHEGAGPRSSTQSITTPDYLVVNGSFECGGLGSWQTAGTVSLSSAHQTGSNSAQISSCADAYSSVGQNAVTIPANKQGELSFYYRFTHTGTDNAVVDLYSAGTELASWTITADASDWTFSGTKSFTSTASQRFAAFTITVHGSSTSTCSSLLIDSVYTPLT